jgi:hypothetical protein
VIVNKWWECEPVLTTLLNPERVGCPPDQTLLCLAAQSAQHCVEQDEDWKHVIHCAPCYEAYFQFRATHRASIMAHSPRMKVTRTSSSSGQKPKGIRDGDHAQLTGPALAASQTLSLDVPNQIASLYSQGVGDQFERSQSHALLTILQPVKMGSV